MSSASAARSNYERVRPDERAPPVPRPDDIDDDAITAPARRHNDPEATTLSPLSHQRVTAMTNASSSTLLRRRSSLLAPIHPTVESLPNDEADDDEIVGDGNPPSLCRTAPSTNPGSSVGLAEYWSVLQRHPMYRAFLASFLCMNVGDYFVRIANVLTVEALAGKDATGAALSHVTLARLVPNAVLALVGGLAADALDRRVTMIRLDVASGIVVLGYLVALRWESLPLLYAVTAVRSALSASYYPSANGILPDLVRPPPPSRHGGSGDDDDDDDEEFKQQQLQQQQQQQHTRDLQLAVTINAWAWGGSVVLGGLLAGRLAAIFGLEACYGIDCATYWISALVLARGIQGSFRANPSSSLHHADASASHKKDPDDEAATLDGRFTIDDEDDLDAAFGAVCRRRRSSVASRSSLSRSATAPSLVPYLVTCGFGWMVLSMPSASFVWGIEDIVGAQFATVFDEHGVEDTKLSSVHMGLLFSVIGIGNSLGPFLINTVTDARKPYTLQRACLIGLSVLGTGWLLISFVHTFPQFLLASLFRTMGSGIAWVNSSLVLQSLADPSVLGRIMALQYSLTTLAEASTVFVAGHLSTSNGLSPNQLALLGAGLGLFVVAGWGTYYARSLGAAHPRFNTYALVSHDDDGGGEEDPTLQTTNNGKNQGLEPHHIELGRVRTQNNRLSKSGGLV